ncbi:hypothetical protein FRC03_003545 [Tulasnella sp. 419]|nr:hypothetical protein FRC03_003545 [Tulasnella sp. 419]
MDIASAKRSGAVPLIHQLPVEILMEIFQWSILGLDVAWERLRQALRLSQVDHRFRQVACETASLWTTLSTHASPNPVNFSNHIHEDYFPILASRSRRLPIDVDIRVWPYIVRWPQDLFLLHVASKQENLARTSALSVSFEKDVKFPGMPSDPKLSRMVNTLLRSLHTVEMVHLTRLSILWKKDYRPLDDINVSLPEAPKLEFIQVGGEIGVGWADAPHYPRLRHLIIKKTVLTDGGLADLFGFLERQSTLETLEIDSLQPITFPIPVDSISLPHLRELRISVLGHTFLYNFLRCLYSPNLRILDIGFFNLSQDYYSWDTLPEHSIGGVEQLVYVGTKFNKRHLLSRRTKLDEIVDRLSECALKSLLEVYLNDFDYGVSFDLSQAMSQFII